MKAAGVRFQDGEVRTGVSSPQPRRGSASVGEQEMDPLFHANAFAGSDDQVVAPCNPAGPDSAPAVYRHNARGGALHGCRQFI
jgi:hypothetical protein